MEQSTSPLPEYDKPPLIEVVFGIQFKALEELKTPHIGAFWDIIGRTEYPKFSEMPMLRHIIESCGPSRSEPASSEFGTMFKSPPLPRLFFISEDDTRLIQLQGDRLLQNWRKRQVETEYPKYRTLFPSFAKSWGLFCDFVQEQGLGELQPDQYELTYVNHIVHGTGWTDERGIEGVFPWFKCKLDGAFLGVPEEAGWRKSYVFPKKDGRLRVEMKQGLTKEDGKPVLVLNLTARGFSEGDMGKWFDLAHEWIVRSFADLTESSVQKDVWKKRK